LAAPAVGASADELDADGLPARADCRTWIPEAARYHGVKPGLLEGIAMAESGRPGAPWPWTLNVGGKGMWIESRARARELMLDDHGQLRDDVAVGCMQIFTRWHADRFESADHMLEPRNNVYFAAWFLRRLYERHGTWTEAVGHYHASTRNKTARRRYVCQVMHHMIRLGHGTVTPSARTFCSGRYAQYLRAGELERLRLAARGRR
jgi:soluble lytic murein transglycosylase-like protein